MRIYSRPQLSAGALAAALVLACAVGASGARLSISNTAIRQVWRPLTFATGPGETGVTVRCNVTLEGSFHYRTTVKQSRALIGYITRAEVRHPCSGGEAWAVNGIERTPNGLPWHITYEGFESSLPNIAGVRVLFRSLIAIEIGVGLCKYEGNAQGVLKLTRGIIGGLLPDNEVALARRSGGLLCPASSFFSQEPAAESMATLLGNTQLITITLI